MLVAMAVAGAVGWAFERVIVRPVYGLHLKQILITMGGMIVGEEIIKVIWGPLQIALPLPDELRGAWLIGDAAIEKYRVLAAAIGLVVLRGAGLHAQPHQDRPAHPRRRAGPRDGRGAGLPHPAPVRRRLRRRLGAGRAGRRAVGAVPAERDAADRRPGQRADLHRHHHRRPGLDLRLLRRRAAGGPDGQLHRLPGAQGGAVLEHRADGGHPAVAAAGPVSGDATDERHAGPPPLARPAAQPLAARPLLVVVFVGAGAGAVPVPGREVDVGGVQDAGLHPARGQLRPAAGLHRHRQLRAHHVLRHRRLRHRDRQRQARRRLGRGGRWACSARWSSRCCCRW